jgi:uncharacterized protein YjiS (DUF1127 family)
MAGLGRACNRIMPLVYAALQKWHITSALAIRISGASMDGALGRFYRASRMAPSAPILLRARRDAMNQEYRFELLDTGSSPTFQNASELGHLVARARQQRAQATAALLRSALGGIGRMLRPVLAPVVRWEQRRATREALMRCSDRVLADIGIEREHIPLVASGIDPADHQLREPALRRWWSAARSRLDAARQTRQERRRLYRELDAYSDRELEEIGLRRVDIPVIARAQPVLRRAA